MKKIWIALISAMALAGVFAMTPAPAAAEEAPSQAEAQGEEDNPHALVSHVTLFRDKNYNSPCFSLTQQGCFNTPGCNDDAESAWVEGTVALCKHANCQDCMVVAGPRPDLSAPGYSNVISSVRLY
ncbi:hypothetical protein [Pendulispora albinea]|uniref:Uncharacterized protein n=1 Tax=Pendulispora albinea TaxID=2741071 RepID=A0ABZ2LZW6_9BACT